MVKKHQRRNNKYKHEIKTLSLALIQNGRAMDESQRKKRWTTHDIEPIQPLRLAQENIFHAWYNQQNICAHGSSGTGKTFISLYLAINDIVAKQQHELIIVRSAVAGRDIGHLPGTEEEKLAVYETPYGAILSDLVGRCSTYRDMKEAGKIRFMSTSYLRGATWDNAIILVDEFQNMTMHEIDSIITRLGENSRIMFCGDTKRQNDLRSSQSCAKQLVSILDTMTSFDTVQFFPQDIVRSDLVKEWILATEQHEF